MCWLICRKSKKHTSMIKGLCGILVATQLMGAWLAVAQTNTHPTTKEQSLAIRVNTSPVAAVSTGRTKPAIAVSPCRLDFGSVLVGRASNLTLTLQNLGGGILNGTAKVSTPFSIIAGGNYSLGSNQAQVIKVQYVPVATGMNITVVRLTGGSGTKITVAGLAVPASPAVPARPQGPSLVAGP